MCRIRRFVGIALLFVAVLPTMAQEAEMEKPEDAFAILTDYIVRKDFGKWHVGGLVEHATVDKGQGLRNSSLLVRPIVGYNVLSWLRLQFQVDFLYSFTTGLYVRYLPEFTLCHAVSDFRFSLRNRLILSHPVSQFKITPTIRTRLRADYLIPQTPLSVYIYAEPYWFETIKRTRYTVGIGYKVNRQFSLSAGYMRSQYYDITKPNQNALYMTFAVRL